MNDPLLDVQMPLSEWHVVLRHLKRGILEEVGCTCEQGHLAAPPDESGGLSSDPKFNRSRRDLWIPKGHVSQAQPYERPYQWVCSIGKFSGSHVRLIEAHFNPYRQGRGIDDLIYTAGVPSGVSENLHKLLGESHCFAIAEDARYGYLLPTVRGYSIYQRVFLFASKTPVGLLLLQAAHSLLGFLRSTSQFPYFLRMACFSSLCCLLVGLGGCLLAHGSERVLPAGENVRSDLGQSQQYQERNARPKESR
jgi:hypothetical protein